MDVVLRPAEKADIPDLARLFIMAADGIVDALYDGLVPGVSTEKLFEWRFSQIGSVKSYQHCWIAQRGPRAIGMVHAYPIDRLADAPTDPRLTADRVAVLAPFSALLERARQLLHQCRRGLPGRPRRRNRQPTAGARHGRCARAGLYQSEPSCVRAEQ